MVAPTHAVRAENNSSNGTSGTPSPTGANGDSIESHHPSPQQAALRSPAAETSALDAAVQSEAIHENPYGFPKGRSPLAAFWVLFGRSKSTPPEVCRSSGLRWEQAQLTYDGENISTRRRITQQHKP